MARRRMTFYGSLERSVRTRLDELSRRRWYDPGHKIYAEGQIATTVMVVLEGRVSVEAALPVGDPYVAICYAGQLLGASEGLSDQPIVRRHTARALDEVGLLVISVGDFTRLAAEEPWLWQAMYRDTQAQLDTAQFWIGQLAAAKSEQRLARVLLFFADQERLSSGKAVVDLSTHQLASWVGVNPRTIERHTEDWEQCGYIIKRTSKVHILKPSALAARAGFENLPQPTGTASPAQLQQHRPRVPRSA